MPSAKIYGDNKLPDIFDNGFLKIKTARGAGLDDGDMERLDRGFVKTILPYTAQDNYDRVKKPRDFTAVIMENDFLKAVILPEIGGRIWSLYDKKRGKELLFKNPVFQPCNFAIRNAWAAGGIEYNVGMCGHSVFTSSTVFCDINSYKNGRETVVLYEYERKRGIVWSVELCLPDDSPALLARVTAENTENQEKLMYWWTNIAVTDETGKRTLAPCDKVYFTNYEDGVHSLGLTDIGDKSVNATYADQNGRSRDYFYKIPDNKDKWLVSADKDGRGMAHTSTDLLKGRKLFLWGTNVGGRNWSEFLSDKGLYYTEIQAGLTYFQCDHITMPANSAWEWTEAYAPFAGDPALIHSKDIQTAQKEAERGLVMNAARIKALDVFGELTAANRTGAQSVTVGSPWGRIENRIREKRGLNSISAKAPFPAVKNDAAAKEWLHLIEKGRFGSEDVILPPESFMTGAYVTELLIKAAADGGGAYTHLQLGTALFEAERYGEALAAWERSMELKPNAWAARNIARLKNHFGDADGACFFMLKAVNINPEYRPLIIDCARLFNEAQRYGDWIRIYEGLNPRLRSAGRIRHLAAIAYLGLDMLDKAEGLIDGGLVIEDLQEGELSLEKLWEELHVKKIMRETGITKTEDALKIAREKYPLPKALNFGMNIKERL